jgi:hypothetical protein
VEQVAAFLFLRPKFRHLATDYSFEKFSFAFILSAKIDFISATTTTSKKLVHTKFSKPQNWTKQNSHKVLNKIKRTVQQWEGASF